MKPGDIRVGTASWSEPEFVKAGWYPPGLPASRRLPYYAERFDMVELNSSFYAIPAARMCERWARETPAGFLFNVKCHRLLSRHATKAAALPPDLRVSAETTGRGNIVLTTSLEEEIAGRFLAELEPMESAGKLGALLLQMTPGFAPRTGDLAVLAPLLRQLRGPDEQPRQVVLELRHRGWLEGSRREETIAFLRAQRVTLASIDGPAADDPRQFTIMPSWDAVTAPRLSYLRLHGRNTRAYLTGRTVAERFHYDYSDGELDEVVERAYALARETETVHVVFNNNSRDFAPRAAERLRRKLGQPAGVPVVPRPGDLF
jgi:uncharacterized protein YecE (DUF72 family)